jgi:hypothetical protein
MRAKVVVASLVMGLMFARAAGAQDAVAPTPNPHSYWAQDGELHVKDGEQESHAPLPCAAAKQMLRVGATLYVACNPNGVAVYDLSSAAPQLTAHVATPESCATLDVDGKFVECRGVDRLIAMIDRDGHASVMPPRDTPAASTALSRQDNEPDRGWRDPSRAHRARLFKGFGIGLLAGGLGIAGLGGIIALIGTGFSAGASSVCRDWNFSGRAQCDSSPTGLYIATGTMAGIGGAFVLAGAILLAMRPSGSGSVSAIPVVPARTPTWTARWATPSTTSALPIVSATF